MDESTLPFHIQLLFLAANAIAYDFTQWRHEWCAWETDLQTAPEQGTHFVIVYMKMVNQCKLACTPTSGIDYKRRIKNQS